MTRARKASLILVVLLGAVTSVFLLVFFIGQGLAKASLWATVLGLPVGLAGATASAWALVRNPSESISQERKFPDQANHEAKFASAGGKNKEKSRTGLPVPRELPPDVSVFTGRTRELDKLNQFLSGGGDSGSRESASVVISAVSGTAGVGKTALAIRWAHQAADRFPDGQLYVNLRGYDPNRPMTSAEALAGFLRALGIPDQDIPAEANERAARYRSLLAGRRILVVLDNARESETARLLLPGDPACAVVVTSRDSLAGLVARHGARRLDLDLLPLEDAVALLRALIGARVDADRGSARTLADQCARLPLALRVIAELALARPSASLAELSRQLADEQQRLDLLDAGGDPHTAVRAVFSWSYRHLGSDAARIFRLLGLHPGPDFDEYAAAALTGAEATPMRGLLERLARAHLVYAVPAGRYAMHDLLRAYASAQALRDDADDDRRAALTRLFDYYLNQAAAAMDALEPAGRQRRSSIEIPAAPVCGPTVNDAGTARAWLDTHRATLTAAAVYTAEHGWPSHTIRLSSILWRYLDYGGHYSEAITIATQAHSAACRVGDLRGQGRALSNLGVVEWQQGRYQEATDHLQQSLELFRLVGDQVGEALTLSNLGLVAWQQGSYQQATDHDEKAAAALHQAGDLLAEARALGNLGVVYERLGRYQQAGDRLQEALALFRQNGDRYGEAYTLTNLASVQERLGHYQQATDNLQEALVFFRQNGDRYGEPYALASLGVVEKQQGNLPQAIRHLEQALDLHRNVSDRPGEAEALNTLGEVLLSAGRPGGARTQHSNALNLSTRIGDRFQQARAHDGLAAAYRTVGEIEEARSHLHKALSLYQALMVPQAGTVQDQLAKLIGAAPGPDTAA